MVEKVVRLAMYFICFIGSFYCLSGMDLGRFMLNTPTKSGKGQLLLIMLSMALGFLVAQFILSIMYNFSN